MDEFQGLDVLHLQEEIVFLVMYENPYKRDKSKNSSVLIYNNYHIHQSIQFLLFIKKIN
jgi:hypothetical protein